MVNKARVLYLFNNLNDYYDIHIQLVNNEQFTFASQVDSNGMLRADQWKFEVSDNELIAKCKIPYSANRVETIVIDLGSISHYTIST